MKVYQNISNWIRKFVEKKKKNKERKSIEELSLHNILERVDEFLKRIKAKMPDFITIGGGLLQYKKWLSEPFLVLDYIPFIPVMDSAERELLNISQNILKKSTKYIQIVEESKKNEQ